MVDNTANKRLAINTILLYIRMLVSLAITLYTSRVVLNILGQDDFGIFNIVGGVVVLFSFLTNAMTSSTQRFLNYNIGVGDLHKIKQVFNTSIVLHLTVMAFVLLLSETIGLWFLEYKLNIPIDRMDAARWVYQTTVIATLFNIIVIPYRATIIAEEKMNIFAILSVMEVLLKLIIVLVLPLFLADKLIIYSILFALTSMICFVLYRQISRSRFKYSRFMWSWNKSLFKEMMNFSGWYLLGGVAMVGSKQGVNIIINLFFNVAVNAAVGIANQVRNAIYGFVTSFQTAFNPQIVKLYASNEHLELEKLLYRSSKFSYFLYIILSLPVIIFSNVLLSIWLVHVPQYSVIFTQLVIIATAFETLSAPLWTLIGASGQVKFYQIFVSVIILLDIPLVWIALELGFSPPVVFWINSIVSFAAYIFRLVYARKTLYFSMKAYCVKVIFPCLLITIMASPVLYLLSSIGSSGITSIAIMLFSAFIIVMMIYVFGLEKEERSFVRNILASKFLKLRNK